MKPPTPQRTDEILTEYWLEHYLSPKGLCVLCGNSGKVDTRPTAFSPAGVPSGRVTFCICPNGREMREVSQ